MPRQRSKDKMFIGGWVPLGVAAGVEVWLNRAENLEAKKDRTAFIIEASIKFLAAEGIEVTVPTEYSVGRPRKQLPKAAFDMVRETGVAVPNSPPTRPNQAVVAAAGDSSYKSESARNNPRRKTPVKRSGQTAAVPPPSTPPPGR